MTMTELPDIYWTFGDVLSKLRRDAGLTGVELAERLEISARSVGNYERDLTRPKRRTVREWAEVCGYRDVDALLAAWADARSRPGPPPHIARYLQAA